MRLAAWRIAEHRLPSGARIAIWAPNSPEWVVCFLAIALHACVAVPIDANQDATAAADIIARTGALLLIHGPGQKSVDNVRSIPLLELVLKPADGPHGWTPAVLHPDSPAVILFTSGSSDEPRGVVLSHGNLMTQLSRFRWFRLPLRMLRFRMLALSPMSHVQGLLLGSLLPLSIGLSVLYVRSLDPGSLVTTMRLGRIAILLAVPGVLALLEQKLRRELATCFRLDPLTSGKLPLMRAVRLMLGPLFRLILTGGSTLPEGQERFWRRMGTLLIQGYGATETTGIASINWPWSGRFGSVGKASDGSSIRVADDGEIQVCGPQVAAGYFVSSQPLEMTEDGYYCTGDLGRIDARKRLYLTGRKKDLIVTPEGHNVSPTHLESALNGVFGVRDSVVCSLRTESRESTHAVLLLADGTDAAACVRQANQELPGGCRIESWSVWRAADFPRGLLGKIRRSEVIRAIGQGSPAAEGEGATFEQCLDEPDASRRLDLLCCYFAQKENSRNFIDIASELHGLGLDSIQIIQLGARLEALQGTPGTFVEQTHLTTAAPSSRPVHLRPEKEKPPKWQYWSALRILRAGIRTVTVDIAIALHARVGRDGAQNLRCLDTSCIFALSAADRQGPLDYIYVYRALPRKLARRVFPLMRSNPPDGFAPYLHDDATVSGLRRWGLAALFHLGLPAMFPFSLFPASTTRSTALGLAHAGTAIERGFCPLTVWGPGIALLAIESRCDVVPVRLHRTSSHEEQRSRTVITVRFGAPVHTPANASHREVASDIEQRLTVTNS